MKNLDTMFTDATCYESEMRLLCDNPLTSSLDDTLSSLAMFLETRICITGFLFHYLNKLGL